MEDNINHDKCDNQTKINSYLVERGINLKGSNGTPITYHIDCDIFTSIYP